MNKPDIHYTDAHTHVPVSDTCARCIVCSAQPQDWGNIIALSKQHPNIIPAIGLHPWYLQDQHSDRWDQLEDILQEHPQCLIGEAGLDKCRQGISPIMEQQKALNKQLELAEKYHRPIVLHCCQTWGKLLETIKNHSHLTYLLHGWNGSEEMISDYLKYSTYFSLGSLSKHWDTAIRQIPINRLLIESDGRNETLIPMYEKIGKGLHLSSADLNQIMINNLDQLINNTL